MLLHGFKYYQNDVIGLVDSNMNEMVTYSYNTWGKLMNMKFHAGSRQLSFW